MDSKALSTSPGIATQHAEVSSRHWLVFSRPSLLITVKFCSEILIFQLFNTVNVQVIYQSDVTQLFKVIYRKSLQLKIFPLLQSQ